MACTSRATGGKGETGGTSETGPTRWDSTLSTSRILACLALHAPRPVALADCFSILLEPREVGCFQRLIRNHLVKRHLHAPLPLPIFQENLKRPQQPPIAGA